MNNPTGYTALDLVGFTDKGTYVSNVYYVKNDIVHYGGNLWRCKVDDTANITPAEGAYWTVFVGEPENLVERIIAPLEENPAIVAYGTGRQIIYDDWLWEVIADIAVGDSLVDYAVDPSNANIRKADPVETQLLSVKAKEGELTDLSTTAKTNLVAAINEVKSAADTANTKVGSLTNLTTTAKTDAVSAINEVKSAADSASNKVGTLTNLTTTSKTDAVSAINEVKSAADAASTKVGTLSNLATTVKTDAVSAINEVKGTADSASSAASTASGKVGTLSNLTTTAKTDTVSAINEVKSAADTASNKVGTLTNLTTTSKTDTVSAINEVKSAADSTSNKVGTLSNLTTTTKTDLVSAINELDGDVGNLSSLDTTVKTSAVAAINEVNTKVSKTEVLISNNDDKYDSTRPYEVGEYCIHEDVLYKCTTACSAGSWTTNQSCFTADTLTGALNDLKADSITQALYVNNTPVSVYKNNKTIVCSFANATISQIITALQNVPKPDSVVRSIIWNYTDDKVACINISPDGSVIFINTNPWTVISDTSTAVHGEITWIVI